MYVPLLDLKAQYSTIQQEIEDAVLGVLRAQTCILGEPVKSFEDKCAQFCGTNYAIGVSSGTDALIIALLAANIQPGDEVITTPYSFFSTAGSIYRMGARAIFVDIESDSYNIDPNLIEQAITPKTKAIMPVHLYGQCANMDAINEIAKRHGIVVIEDAAQAFGAEYQGKKAGSLSDFGCFSFYPSKNLGGIGDGGLVTLNDEKLYKKIIILRNHGCTHQYYHEMVGGNFRLDAVQAAALAVKIGYLKQWNKARAKNADDYRCLFAKAGLTQIDLPSAKEGHSHIYNQFVIRAPKRDELRAFISEKKIGNSIYYPLPLNKQPCFAEWGCNEQNMPVSDNAAKTTLALPIYPELTMEQKQYVVDSIVEFYQSSH